MEVFRGFRLGSLGVAVVFGLLAILGNTYLSRAAALVALVSLAVVSTAALAIPLGMLSGLTGLGRKVVPLLLEMVEAVPPVLYLIVTGVIFGFGPTEAIVLTVFIAVPTVVRVIATGMTAERADAPDQPEPALSGLIVLGLNHALLVSILLVGFATEAAGEGLVALLVEGIEEGKIVSALYASFALFLAVALLARFSLFHNKTDGLLKRMWASWTSRLDPQSVIGEAEQIGALSGRPWNEQVEPLRAFFVRPGQWARVFAVVAGGVTALAVFADWGHETQPTGWLIPSTPFDGFELPEFSAIGPLTFLAGVTVAILAVLASVSQRWVVRGAVLGTLVSAGALSLTLAYWLNQPTSFGEEFLRGSGALFGAGAASASLIASLYWWRTVHHEPAAPKSLRGLAVLGLVAVVAVVLAGQRFDDKVNASGVEAANDLVVTRDETLEQIRSRDLIGVLSQEIVSSLEIIEINDPLLSASFDSPADYASRRAELRSAADRDVSPWRLVIAIGLFGACVSLALSARNRWMSLGRGGLSTSFRSAATIVGGFWWVAALDLGGAWGLLAISAGAVIIYRTVRARVSV